MAFTGAATVVQVNAKTCRITGISLAKSATGTIGLPGSGADVALPATFAEPNIAIHGYGGGAALTPSDEIKVDVIPAGASTAQCWVTVTKAGVAFSTPFLATLTNNDVANSSPALEVYVTYL